MQTLTIYYRSWKIQAADRTATGTRFDGSEERFEIAGLPCFEEALRLAKAKVNRMEGEEVWNEEYTDEALR
jgi:hypothetical protein